MKDFLTKILFVFLVICTGAAWILADSSNQAEAAQKKAMAAAEERAAAMSTTAAEETDVPTSGAEITETSAPETTVPETTEKEEVRVPDEARDIVLLFGGDINLDKNYSNFTGAGSAAACIDASLLSEMQAADIFMHGHVFALTDGGTPMKKAYLFRAEEKDASLLTELGTDIVSLANNHSFDYGDDGMRDTLDTLAEIGVAHVGAGLDEAAAKTPHYVEIGGKRIAFTAAMRSEKYPRAPEADGNDGGVVKMYDIDEYLEIIREAKANADIVVAYAHWGVENTIWLEQEQLDGARAMIDAGADIVVGAHSHTLQTAEIYNGKPIFYGLGDLHGEGGLAKITISAGGDINASVIPFNDVSGIATPLSGDALSEKLEELDFISEDTVDQTGSLTE